jgi:hypothetical protein
MNMVSMPRSANLPANLREEQAFGNAGRLRLRFVSLCHGDVQESP